MPASYLRASTLAALFVVAASFGPVRAQAQNGFEGSGGITHDTVKGTVSIPERKRRGT